MKKCVNGQYIEMTPEEIAAMQPTPLSLDEQKNILRAQREVECWPWVNRGEPWRKRLTPEQQAELDTWYQEWLDVTDTLTPPKKPDWLK